VTKAKKMSSFGAVTTWGNRKKSGLISKCGREKGRVKPGVKHKRETNRIRRRGLD